MFKIIKRHKIRTGFILGTILLLCVVLILKHKFEIELFQIVSSEQQQEIFFFGISSNNWCIFITIFELLAGGLWGLHEYDTRKRQSQQEKAAEIAEKFARELITDMTIVGAILTKYEPISSIVNNIDFNKLKRFDIYEIEKISKNKKIDNIKEFKKIVKSTEIDTFFHNFLKQEICEKYDEFKEIKFSHYLNDTLNKLEAICINVSSTAAGTEYIYPSLHQVLLPFIENTALPISSNNGNYTFKFFINIIDVYNNWKKIRDKEQKQELKEQKNIQKKKEKYENKVQKYSKKINSTIDKTLEKKPRKI